MATGGDDSSKRAGLIIHSVYKSDLKPGDHIYCYRALFAYSHHGIYIGERDCEVIHFAGRTGETKSKSTAGIRKCTLAEFLDGDQLRLVAYDTQQL